MLKIIPLLLAALGLVSAAAYAAPELRVTNIGQEVEIEHVNGTDDTTAWLYNKVGLAYGDDWTFGFEGSKQWNYDNDDKADAKGKANDKGVSSKDSRLIFDAWKRINEDLKLGVRYRGHDDNERFMVRYDYSHGMFLSSGDFWYQFNEAEGTADTLRAEWFPIGVKIGPVTAKYLIDYTEMVGGTVAGEQESEVEHQLRLYAPLYKWDRLSLSTEARITLHHEKDFNGTEKHEVYEDFGRNRIYLKADYAVSENLGVYVQYAYELREREAKDGYPEGKVDNADDQLFIFGWNYKF